MYLQVIDFGNSYCFQLMGTKVYPFSFREFNDKLAKAKAIEIATQLHCEAYDWEGEKIEITTDNT